MRGAVNLLHGLRTSLKYAYKNANLDYKLFMKTFFDKIRTKSSNEKLVYTSQT